MSQDHVEVVQVLKALNALVDEVLFGPNWPSNTTAINYRLTDLGLQENGLGDSGTRSTKLGRLVEIDLYMAFLGLWDEGELPIIMEGYHLFTRQESEWLWDHLEAGANMNNWLKARLQVAYRSYFGQRRNN